MKDTSNISLSDDFTQLYDSGKKFLSSLTEKETYDKLTTEALKIVEADKATIYLWNGEQFESVYTTVPEVEQMLPRKDGLAYAVLASKELCLIPREEIIRYQPKLARTTIQARLYIPIAFDDLSLGVLTLRFYKKKTLSLMEMQKIKIFGAFASLVLHKLALKKELEEIKEIKNTFINYAAHELRTPLTSMNVYVNLLKNKKNSDELHKDKFINGITLASVKLANIVNKLVAADSLNAKVQFEFQEVQLQSFLTKVIEEFSQLYTDQLLHLQFDDAEREYFINADTQRLREAIMQILQNAKNFSKPEKPIYIQLIENETHYIISIIDHGIGFHSSETKLIGKEFFKAKDNYQQGMGLGLYIARKIIEQHRGFITINSRKNKGTSVQLYLPKTIK